MAFEEVEFFDELPEMTFEDEYFEEFDSNDKKVTPAWQGTGRRQIRVVTTTRIYGSGSSRGDPVVSVSYEYL